jgi:hypothetical protein
MAMSVHQCLLKIIVQVDTFCKVGPIYFFGTIDINVHKGYNMYIMKAVQDINATKARNDFFNLLKKSYLDKKTYLIKKGDIPMAYLIPVTIADNKNKIKKAILNRAKELRDSMQETSDSVDILRSIRKNV